MAKDWVQDLNSANLKDISNSALDDGVFDYTETLQLLQSASVSGFSSEELEDLRLIYSKDVFDTNYLKTITYNVVYDNPANTYWWGGATKLAQVSSLGNASSSIGNQNVADKLIRKWFLGEDLPMPVSGGDTANPDASAGVYKYGFLTGELFSEGISAVDVNQGQSGTCYLVASMDAIAYANPEIIKDAFVVNPNGTIGVKFYFGDEEIYTTVNNEIPVTDWGSITYTGNVDKDVSGESWAALMEKAYVQANAQVNLKFQENWTKGEAWVKINGNWTRQYVDYENARASYKFMEGGWANPLKQVSGLSFDYWRFSDYGLSGDYNSITNEKDVTKVKDDIITALNDGGIGWIAFWGASYRKDDIYSKVQTNGSKQEAVGGHAFALHSYDEATDTFLISNPWTESNSWSSYNTTFSLPLEFLWDSHFKPTVAITNPAAEVKNFNYTISSEASLIDGAVEEGQSVSITITRDGSGKEETVYISTADISTSDGDIIIAEKKPLIFARDETSKVLEVATLSDGLVEDTESFQINLFKSYTSVTPDASITAFVKDVSNGDFAYTISSNASSVEAGVSEGDNVEVIITRDSTGTASTIYLSTEDNTTSTSDLDHLSFQAVKFSAKETVKTVYIETHEDQYNEGTESFNLNMFDAPSQTIPTVTHEAFIKDEWAPEFSYTVFSSAPTESLAASEGDNITFTIMRTGSGSTSTVYLKSFFNSADFSDLVYAGDHKITFSPNESIETFTVKTTEDVWLESTESFGYKLYTSETSEVAEAKALAFIKDKLFDDFEYALSATDMSVDEGTSFVLNVTRKGEGDISKVYLSTRHGTTTAEDLESVNKQEISFSQKETLKSITIDTFGDSDQEDTENFWIDLYLNENDTAAAYSVKVDINNVEQTNDFSYEVSSTSIDEGETATFTVTRDGSGEVSTVWIATSNETADTSDYAELELTSLTFSAKETTKTVQVETFTDTEVEGSTPEYFWLDLYKEKSDYLSGDYASYGYADIVDTTDENATSYSYEIQNQNGYSVIEGETATFKITRNSSGSESTIYIQTSPGTADESDFKSLAATAITFGPKETSKTVSVDTVTDSTDESSEYFYVDLYENLQAAETGDYLTFDYMIIEDGGSSNDAYTYSVDDVSVTEGEDATFTITRDGSSTASTVYVSTTFDTADPDDIKVITSQAVAFDEGETSKTVTVETLTDSSVEGAETFYLDVFSSEVDAEYGNYIAWGEATLEDGVSSNDAYTYSVDDVSVTEGEDATFTITRDGSSTASTVYVSTTFDTADPDDIKVITSQAVAFDEGETSKTVTVETLTDSSVEGAETFYLDVFSSEVDAEYGNYIAWGLASLEDAVSASETYSYAADLPEVIEGDTATVTITKSGGSASASTIYLLTWPYADIVQGYDYEGFNAGEITFNVGETTKTFSIDTYTDDEDEDTEYFYTFLYQNYSDVIAQNGNYEKTESGDIAYVTILDSSSSSTVSGFSGEATSSSSPTNTFYGHNGSEFQNAYAFARLLDNGTVKVWGDATNGGSASSVVSKLSDVSQVHSNHKAFAAVKSDGSVVAWGNANSGGDLDGLASKLDGTVNVTSVASTKSAFAALREDGSVIAWGSPGAGGDFIAGEQRSDIASIYSNTNAFAALTSAGEIVAWGQEGFGGDASQVAYDANSPFVHIYSTSSAFAALTDNGSVSTWGNVNDGGDSSLVASQLSNVTSISSTSSAFAALLENGSVVTWGNFTSGADSGSVALQLNGVTKVTKVFSNDYAFAALRSDGSVVTWGSPALGGDSSSVASNLNGTTAVTQIYSNSTSFLAIHEDSTITSWGLASHGGDNSSIMSLVDGSKTISSVAVSETAYTILFEDGSFVTWGDFADDAVSRVGQLMSDNSEISSVEANNSAFFAIDSNGNTIAWGDSEEGGTYSEGSVTVTTSIVTPSGVGLPGTTITVTQGTVSSSYESDSSGELSTTLNSNTSVTVSADLEYLSSTKAITSQDALDALRIAVGLDTSEGTPSAYDFISADINQDGKVTSADALDILKYAVGLNVENPARWVFLDASANYANIGKNNTNYSEGITLSEIYADTSISLTGILIGDVNDSYSGNIA